MKWILTNTCVLALITVLATVSPAWAADLKYSGRENAVTQESEDGEYKFSLYSVAPELPLKKIHSWILHIENKQGQPVENAKVFVFGGMPIHKHGFPTKPRVKGYLGNGDYKVEGVKFNMPGDWEMRFNIKDKRKRSRAVFKIKLAL